MGEGIEFQEVPFDMTKETLKSIRLWIDKITQLSVCIVSGVKIDSNEMIVLKQKMVKQLIVLSSPLLGDDLDEVEKFFSKITLRKARVKIASGWIDNMPVYSQEVDYELDECVQGIEKSLSKYFIPKFRKGEKY